MQTTMGLYPELWATLDALADDLCHGRWVALGGGGYNPWTVTRYWTGLWGTLSGRAIPEALPQAARAICDGLRCELIDDEDVLPRWHTTLADPPNEGPVRDEVRMLRDQALRQAEPGLWSATMSPRRVACAG